MRQRRLETQRTRKEEWLRKAEISNLINEMKDLELSENKEEWQELDEETELLEEWLIMACDTGTLVDEDIDMTNSIYEAEIVVSDESMEVAEITEEEASMMEIIEDDWLKEMDVDVSEQTEYDDDSFSWLDFDPKAASCVADGGPAAGKMCNFQFRYQGKTYYECAPLEGWEEFFKSGLAKQGKALSS